MEQNKEEVDKAEEVKPVDNTKTNEVKKTEDEKNKENKPEIKEEKKKPKFLLDTKDNRTKCKIHDIII